MKLVENARQAWKWLSVQIAALGLAIEGAAAAIPSIKQYLSDTTLHWVGAAILVSIIGGRLIAQNGKKPDDKNP